jgi:hypothetical protein
MTREKPPVFNVDCEGLDFDTYQFLLGDIAQAIEDGNRMYGFGEPGYIGADGNFHPFTADNDNKPKISRAKTRTRKPSTEVAIARGIIKIHSPMEVRKEVNH